MKILHIVGESEYGGGTVYTFSILKRLIKEGHSVCLLTTNSETIQEAGKLGIPVVSHIAIRREINIFQDSKALFSLTRYIKREKYDIVHTHTSKGGFIGRIAARLAGTPKVVHTIHGFYFNKDSPFLKKLFYGGLEKTAGWFGHIMIAVNNEDREMAIKYGIVKREKIITIYNGVNIEKNESSLAVGTGYFHCCDIKKEFNISKDDILIGIVGRLYWEKGQMYGIEAIGKLKEHFPGIKLLLIGKGPDEDNFKYKVKELGLDDSVIFTGFRKDIADWLEIMDIFLLPSLREGMSITLLEAMAAGKPIICTDIRGNREVINDGVNGLLVKPKSVDDIVEKVKLLVEDRELAKRLSLQAKEDYMNNFTEDIMLDKIMGVYAKSN